MLVRQPADEAQRGLLRRIADGDHHALGELYDQLARVLFSTAVHILGDPREAEEVVQDVFVQVWTKARTFDPALGAPFHWTLCITRNRCIDFLRSRQRRSRLLDEVAQSVQATAAPPASHAGERLSPGELAAVRGALEALPPDQQHAISLAFFGGMTHAEIAAALSEPLGTVKARIRRGMLKLRDDLEAYV